MQDNQSCLPFQELLPGLPSQIILGVIIPKLQWRDFYFLSSVSRAWYSAIRSRQVYDARLWSLSKEPIVYCHYDDTIALHSLRESSWHKLPSIPDIRIGRSRIPPMCQCVSMNGRIYVLGGQIDCETSNRVFMFELSGQGRWEECASMKHDRRQEFGCAAKDDKIYVFGGNPTTSLLSLSEVYDPKENTWSSIQPMTSLQNTYQSGQNVSTVGEELFIHDSRENRRENPLNAYHPFKDEWREVKHSWRWKERLFTAQGELYSIRPCFVDEEYDDYENKWTQPLGIYAYDLHESSWTELHHQSHRNCTSGQRGGRCNFRSWFHKPGYDDFELHGILAVEDELVALVSCLKSGKATWDLCLFQSRGFRSEEAEISWELRAIPLGKLSGQTSRYIYKL